MGGPEGAEGVVAPRPSGARPRHLGEPADAPLRGDGARELALWSCLDFPVFHGVKVNGDQAIMSLTVLDDWFGGTGRAGSHRCRCPSE